MKKYILLALCAAALASCEKKQTNIVPTPPPGNDELWPMKVGNEWTYKTTTYDSAGAITSSNTYAMKFLSTRSDGTNEFYTFDNYLYYRGDANVVYMADSSLASPRIYFKKVTQDEVLYHSAGGTDTDTTMMYAATTRIGEWDCLKVEEWITTTGGQVRFKAVTYLAPGVGVVKNELYGISMGGTLHRQLVDSMTSYTLQ